MAGAKEAQLLTATPAFPTADKVSNPWKDQFISNTTYPNLIAYPKDKTTGIDTVLETGQKP